MTDLKLLKFVRKTKDVIFRIGYLNGDFEDIRGRQIKISPESPDFFSIFKWNDALETKSIIRVSLVARIDVIEVDESE